MPTGISVNFFGSFFIFFLSSSLKFKLAVGLSFAIYFSVCFNALEKAKIQYFAELVLMSEDEIKNIKNLGKKSLEEISEKFASLGYPIEDTLPEDIASALRKKLEQLKA